MSKKAKFTPPPHGNTVYPWPLWENGEWHRAKRGKHFQVSAGSFRSGLQKRASAQGLKATTRVNGDVVTFRFSRRDS